MSILCVGGSAGRLITLNTKDRMHLKCQSRLTLTLWFWLLGFWNGPCASHGAEPLISLASQWRYNTQSIHPVGWRSVSYDDSAWSVQKAVISFGSLSGGRSLALRSSFVFNGEPRQVALKLSFFTAGGAIFYLNGEELGRYNLDDAAVGSSGLYACHAGPTNIVLHFLGLDAAALLQGTNVLAAEIFPRMAEALGPSYEMRRVFDAALEAVPLGHPQIISQPLHRAILSGEPIDLEATTQGGEPMRYEWEKNGVLIEGASGPRLQIAFASVADSGLYRLRVWNDRGELWSRLTQVQVVPNAKPGSVDPSWRVEFAGFVDGETPSVSQVHLQQDGRMLVAGSFSQVNCVAGFSGAARLLADSTVDPTFQPPALTDIVSGSALRVRAIRELKNGKILLAGVFGKVNGTPRAMFAWLNADGTLDVSRFLKDSRGPISFSYARHGDAIAELDNGQLLLGGDFTLFSGSKFHYGLIRVNEDGTLDQSFQPPLPEGCGVRVIHPLPSKKCLVGGRFIGFWNSNNTIYSGDLLRLEENGSADPTFPISPELSEVTSIVAAPDGSVYAGGLRKNTTCNNIVRLAPNGELDEAFRIVPCDPTDVYSLAVQSNGALIVNGTARFRPDGVKDDTFGPAQLPQGYSGAFAKQLIAMTDDRVLAVGSFMNWDRYFTGPFAYLQAAFYPPDVHVGKAREGVLRISWPEWAREYELQSANRLDDPIAWSTVSAAAATLSERYWQLEIEAAAVGRFYRLKRR